jgi:hypothetical protein
VGFFCQEVGKVFFIEIVENSYFGKIFSIVVYSMYSMYFFLSKLTRISLRILPICPSEKQGLWELPWSTPIYGGRAG